jgi:signal transduction histidine kinase
MENLGLTLAKMDQPAQSTSHPLDMIPVFRRWPASFWRDILYTGIWNSAIACMLAAANSMYGRANSVFTDFLFSSLIVSNVVGYLIHFGLLASDLLTRGWPSRSRGLPRTVYFVGSVSLFVVVGIALGSALLSGNNPLRYLLSANALAKMGPFVVVMAVFMFVVLQMGERRIQAETLAARQNELISETARLLAEARLQALQAQIEPHFLYNTLANVLSLIDTQPVLARHMLERFIAYLRASLLASRAGETTLGAEAELIAAYLEVLTVRMGARLRYRIEIDPALRDLRIAPMLLQPLVENAINHGLEPKIEGGEVILSARMEQEMLCISITDTGVGLSSSTAPKKSGGGVGMSNLRERLHNLYAGSAKLQLIENQPSGLSARLFLPLGLTQNCPSNVVQ